MSWRQTSLLQTVVQLTEHELAAKSICALKGVLQYVCTDLRQGLHGFWGDTIYTADQIEAGEGCQAGKGPHPTAAQLAAGQCQVLELCQPASRMPTLYQKESWSCCCHTSSGTLAAHCDPVCQPCAHWSDCCGHTLTRLDHMPQAACFIWGWGGELFIAYASVKDTYSNRNHKDKSSA